jgi:hypothetical protein
MYTTTKICVVVGRLVRAVCIHGCYQLRKPAWLSTSASLPNSLLEPVWPKQRSGSREPGLRDWVVILAYTTGCPKKNENC